MTWMHRYREKIAWDHTAAILATIINSNRDPKRSTPVDPNRINPYRKDERRAHGFDVREMAHEITEDYKNRTPKK